MALKHLLRLITLAMLATGSPALADDANDIDLKLFGQNVIQGWDGCRFGLWQHNRNPEQDRYAYVLFAPIPDGEALLKPGSRSATTLSKSRNAISARPTPA